MGYKEIYKIIDIITSIILTIGFIFTIKDIKDILKEESIVRFLINGLLFSLTGIVMNILFNIIL